MEHSAQHTTARHDDQHHGGGTKEIWRVFWILLVLTIVELAIGYWMIGMEEGGMGRLVSKIVIIILMLAKAVYIVGYFMHLKHEIRNLIMTIVVPLSLLIWGIIAFLYDGNAFKDNRNTFDAYKRDAHQIKSTDTKADEKGKHHEKRTGAME